MRFIDLFAGLGGFHVGLSNLGFNCVFASEIDSELRNLYQENFSIPAWGDIKLIPESKIPEHDILCAGFPCQPFSKAGAQQGLDDLDRGTLFYDIVRILQYHKPEFFILENVPNLKNHDNGKTWKVIVQTLIEDLGYAVESKKLSPHEFGIPQLRDRLFIVGSKSGLENFNWPNKHHTDLSIRNILDFQPDDAKNLPERESHCLSVWQEFLNRIPKTAKLPSFPIWAMEFGATYPFEGIAPFHLTRRELDNYLGKFGSSLHGMQKIEQLERLPKYSRSQQINRSFPKWKQNFIRQNRAFYEKYKSEISPILKELILMPPSWQKLEWNCQGETRNIYDKIIQFRSSGIRVKRANYTPALVASTMTQVPVISWENRYLTKKEAARLQSMGNISLPESDTAAFKALGNAVNGKLVELIAEKLCHQSKCITRYTNETVSIS